MQASREKEETFRQLYEDYNTVLKRLSMAENTIDEMRLGANVNLFSEGPRPGRAEEGVLPGPQHAHTFTLGRVRTASLSGVGGQGGPLGSSTLGEMGEIEVSSSQMGEAW